MEKKICTTNELVYIIEPLCESYGKTAEELENELLLEGFCSNNIEYVEFVYQVPHGACYTFGTGLLRNF